MNKTELVKTIAVNAGMTQKESAKFLDAFQMVITDAVASGDSVDIMGFGSFSLRKRDARKMVSFGKEIEVPASKTVGFKAGKTLKDAVN
jgi:nucleoid DNA-binding protein